MDNNESLYKIAHKRLSNRANIIKGDIRVFNKNFKNKFDIVISQRVLINILNESDQKKSLKNIISYLKKNGKLIAIESFNSGLKSGITTSTESHLLLFSRVSFVFASPSSP